MVYNWRRTTMKKTILMGIAALVVCGSVNATSWRVCSKPEAGANFLSVADAVASNSVFAGDTLYIEPGHYEGTEINITKSLVLIGLGHSLTINDIITMDNNEAVFSGGVTLSATGTKVLGCKFLNGITSDSDNLEIAGCYINGGISTRGSNTHLHNCYIIGTLHNDLGMGFYATCLSWVVENNIILGSIQNRAYGGRQNYKDWILRNNTIVSTPQSNQFVVHELYSSQIYNNIIFNSNPSYETTNNPDQTIDTTWYKDFTISYLDEDNNNVSNNILSSKTQAHFFNCTFNATVEDVLIWNDANTLEEKYKHKTPGPAVGAGVNGTTCGAYGAVNGGRAYQPAGIPQYRPYIYDAQIDETPSSNNTINASFKIKVQQ